MRMKNKSFIFFVAGAVFFLGACAPKQPIAPLQKPLPPPAVITGTEKECFSKAEALHDQGRYRDALWLYRRCAALFPDGALTDMIWLKIAAVHNRLAEHAEAQAAYEKLLAAFPRSPLAVEAMLGLLDIYNTTGRYEEAIRFSFEIPADRLSDDQLLEKYRQLGRAYQGSDSPADAFYFFSLVYDGTTGEARNRALQQLKGALESMKSVHIDHLLRRIRDPLLRGYLLYRMARISLDAGRVDRAVEVLSDISLNYPQHELAGPAVDLLAEIYIGALASPYTVGCLLPLSGPYRVYGERALRGIELAFNRYHAALPFADIELIVKDTAGDALQAVEAVREMDRQKAAAILGPIITAEAAALEAQSRGIPIITFTQKDHITDIGDFVFRNFITPEMQVAALADFAVGRLGLDRFAVLYPDENYGTTFLNLFWDEILRRQGEIAAVAAYDPAQTDFAVPIQKLVGLFHDIPAGIDADFHLPPLPSAAEHTFIRFISDFLFEQAFAELVATHRITPPENPPPPLAPVPREPPSKDPEPIVDFAAVFIPDAPKKAGLIIPQLAFFDVEGITLLGTNLWHSAELIDMSRKYIQGALVPDGFYAQSAGSPARTFVENFEKAFASAPGFVEAVTFDSAALLFEMIGRPGIRFRSHIKDAILNLVHFQGATGRTSFDYKGDAIKGLYLLQISRGGFVERQRP